MSSPPAREVARAHPNRTLGILVLGAIAYALAQTMVIPALPAIQHDLGASQEAATWLLTVFLLTSSVSTPLLGRFGDMYGKENVLLVALGVFAARALRVRDRQLARGDDPRPGDPGRRRGDLPARLRDHPRRVPAASAWRPRSD